MSISIDIIVEDLESDKTVMNVRGYPYVGVVCGA